MVSKSAASGLFRVAASGGGASVGDSTPGLPIVTTGPVVTTSGATLANARFRATVQPNGFDTAVFFRYQKDGSTDPLSTGTIEVSSQILSSTVTVDVTGLDLSSDYEVTAWAFHTEGPFVAQEVSGGVVEFSTGAASGVPPTVITNAPTQVAATTVTLNGSVNPNSTATEAWFELVGPTEITLTARQDVGAGSAFVAFAQDVVGLTAGTAYQYYAAAENADGQETHGNTLSFVTAAAGSAPTVTEVRAEDIAATAATLVAEFDTGGLDGFLLFQIGTTSAYEMPGIQLPISSFLTIAFSPIQGLAAGTLYYLRASLSNAQGISVSEGITFTTLGAGNFPTGDTTLPTDITQFNAKLHALIDPNTETTTVYFEYWEDTGVLGSEPLVLTVYATSTSASATPVDFSALARGLQPFHTYAYRALASNASGSLTGQVVRFKTAGGAGGVTLIVTTTTPATNITSNSAKIAGTLEPDTVTTTYYFEFWITGQNVRHTQPQLLAFDNVIASGIGDPPVAVYEDLTGLAASTTYNFRLCGVNAASPGIVYGTTRTFTTAAPPGNDPASGTTTLVVALSSTVLDCRGIVLTNGEDTDVQFQASVSPAFTAIAASSTIETFLDPAMPGVVHHQISGLTASTAYYVRMKMTHAAGPVVSYSNTYGPVSTNAIVLPTVTTNALSGATPTTLQASSSVTIPSQTGAGDTFAWFAYGTTTQPTGQGYDVVTAEVNLGQVAGTYSPTLQMGGPQSPPPLIPSTAYYCRAFARNAGGTKMGSEVGPTSTSAPSGGSVPAPVATPVTFNIPNSFNMHGSVLTNGSDTTIVFQFVDSTLGHLFDTADMIELPSYVVADFTGGPRLVGRNTGYHAAASHAWQFRIKATNAGGTAYSAAVQVPAVAATSFAVQPVQNFTPSGGTTHVGFLDWTKAHIRMWFKHDPYGRIWMQMIWGTDPTLATYTAGRMVSFSANPSDPPTSPEYLECHYADDLTGLAQSTTYYYRLRCWSAGGDHIGPISQFLTDAIGRWSGTWSASVGTRIGAGNIQTLVPRDLRAGTGTIARSTNATETTHDCEFGNFTYASGAEDAYSIFVTPTSITKGAGYDAAHPTLPVFVNKTQTDRVGGCNIAYAITNSAIGDKIWVDGSARGMLYRFDNGTLTGLIVAGNTVSDTGVVATATWTAQVTYISNVTGNKCIALRLLSGTLPNSGAAGSAVGTIYISNDPSRFITGCLKVQEGGYTYQAPDIGGDGGATGDTPKTTEGYWKNGLIYYPVTGLRILALDPAFKPRLNQMGLHRDHGGVNGVFFKNIAFARGIWGDNYCVAGSGLSGAGGGGVVGFYDCTFVGEDIDGSLGNRGVKTMVKGDAPHTWDFRRCTFGPAQEHSLYGESFGALNPQDQFFLDNAISGTNWDGTKDFNGRTMLQQTSRGDHWQNAGTGSGFPPGRGTFYVERNTARTDSTDGGQAFSFWGYHGTLNVADNRYLGSASVGSIDSGGFLTQMDTGKGGWFNEHGFAVMTLNLTRWTTAVDNSADSAVQINSTEVVNITDFLFTMNNRTAFVLLGPNSSFDNGLVTFTLTLGTGILTTYEDTANPRTFGWDPTTTWSNRMQHNGTSISRGTTVPSDPAAVNAFQSGVQYWALY